MVHRLSHQVILEHPEDSYYEMKDYCEEFGDPHTNGRNHKITTIEDESGNMVPAVLVPARRIHKLKRRKVYAVPQTGQTSFQIYVLSLCCKPFCYLDQA